MRSQDNFFELGLVLELIQRQVTTVEQTMHHGIDELADNMSQATDPVNASFDVLALVPSYPMPTG